MYEELVKNLRENVKDGCSDCTETAPLILQAADAIEYMNGHAKVLEKLADYWCERVPKWIPVTERLPEDNVRVLTCDGNGNIHIFSHYHGFAFSFGIRPTDPRYYMVKWWMPLPEPPESEGE